jgi:predicted TIM-barrel fold metal-dependent hydrolase
VGKRFLAGKKKEEYRDIVENFQWDDWRGPWDPVARLKDMDLDGVHAEVLYPSTSRKLFALKDPSLQCACLRAYNDWLNDYCSETPNRLIGLVALSALDIDWSVRELQRCSALKFRGAFLLVFGGGKLCRPEVRSLVGYRPELNFPFPSTSVCRRSRQSRSIVNKMGSGIEARDRGPVRSATADEPVEMIFGGVLSAF